MLKHLLVVGVTSVRKTATTLTKVRLRSLKFKDYAVAATLGFPFLQKSSTKRENIFTRARIPMAVSLTVREIEDLLVRRLLLRRLLVCTTLAITKANMCRRCWRTRKRTYTTSPLALDRLATGITPTCIIRKLFIAKAKKSGCHFATSCMTAFPKNRRITVVGLVTSDPFTSRLAI
jgi:hypothetical protein